MSNNKNLTVEQKLVLFKEETEPPGSSKLNNEKREGDYHCVNCGVKLFDSKTKYESGSGWPSFFNPYLMFLKQKPIIFWAILEQNIIAKIVVVTMATYLMMDQNLQEKDIVIMVFV